MKRQLLMLAACFLALGTSQAYAVPQVINDIGAGLYIGGQPNYVPGPTAVVPAGFLDDIRNTYQYSDVIGGSDFEVQSMSVDFISLNTLQVVIHSNFIDHVGELNVGLGDLFISTTGWNPGYSDSSQNWYGHGQQAWDKVVQLNNRDGDGGTLSIYDLIEQNVIFSGVSQPDANKVRLYRSDQEVRYNGANQQAIGSGNWVKDMVADTLTLNIVFGTDFSPNAIWGFHWSETCGNDIVEGAASTPVPEPSTVALLAAAFCGSLPWRKRKRA